ncbi:21 kDa protein-like [Impatiens glandulifera]|uniref:21 kDa protein-like n=1 Tax=Impatiens glandulifera TaxID=253017 RepID=UPI001FB132B7|nr:21 kDa protein-like [Impatiens glandulifera]
MALVGLYITTLLMLSKSCIASPSPSPTHLMRVKSYIEAQCKGTQYPITCIQCLSNYVKETPKSPQELAHLSLEASLIRAKYAKEYVIEVANKLKETRPKSRDYISLKDCLEQINDGMDQLRSSLQVMKTIDDQNGEANFMLQMNDIQTWLSAAWTDAATCVDGLPNLAIGGKVKAIIREKMLNVAQTSTNALVFLDRFASKHRITGAKTNP